MVVNIKVLWEMVVKIKRYKIARNRCGRKSRGDEKLVINLEWPNLNRNYLVVQVVFILKYTQGGGGGGISLMCVGGDKTPSIYLASPLENLLLALA